MYKRQSNNSNIYSPLNQLELLLKDKDVVGGFGGFNGTLLKLEFLSYLYKNNIGSIITDRCDFIYEHAANVKYYFPDIIIVFIVDSAVVDSVVVDSAVVDSALVDSAVVDSAFVDSAVVDSAFVDSFVVDSESKLISPIFYNYIDILRINKSKSANYQKNYDGIKMPTIVVNDEYYEPSRNEIINEIINEMIDVIC